MFFIRLLAVLYVSVTLFCRELLNSRKDGIEISYNTCGVLANIMSDGHSVWSERNQPPRSQVLSAMVEAISWWDLSSRRSINYRFTVSIFSLL
jgi:hypothetical protein